MPITASALYRDTMNFTRNQFVSILLLSLLASLITVVLGHLFTPGSEQLQILNDSNIDLSAGEQLGLSDLIQQMSPEQQIVLLKASAAGTFASLVGNTLLVGGLLLLIQMVSAGTPTSALRAIGSSLPILPRLLLLILICTLLIQLGMLFLIVPGVLLAIVLSLSPVISATEKRGVFTSMRQSSKLVFANFRVTAPAVLLWLVAKVVLLLLVARLPLAAPTVMAIVINGLSNFISALLLIYLFRLYMLLRN
ncbi:YciC family protein [Lonsdalea quercina]|uniref:YciC family protein n=1 Tax=Lonsdalea quercina TaxID=71657 RepID=UPI003975F9AC